ncbi:hypothetical protein ACFOW6_04525 [Fodinicurvata halophila]|uniref:Uncharacterized protein n=1 Tax=Fodinicurvata halophila TaxID=1419723 RepID=A0ABV8UIR3_9PROT
MEMRVKVISVSAQSSAFPGRGAEVDGVPPEADIEIVHGLGQGQLVRADLLSGEEIAGGPGGFYQVL